MHAKEGQVWEKNGQVMERPEVRRPGTEQPAEVEGVRQLEILEKEGRDRAGYERQPQDMDEVRFWAGRAVWPEE